MRAAAELEAVVALDPDGAHLLAILLVEERVGAAIDGLLHGHHLRPDRQVVADDAPDLVCDGPTLLVGERPVEREVEAQVARRHERSGLARRRSHRIADSPVEQMRGRVVAHGAGAPFCVDDGTHGLSDRDVPAEDPPMDDEAADRALGVLDREQQ